MIRTGMKIQTPGMLLKVKEVKGSWVRCDYFDKHSCEWKPRGCTERKAHLEAGLKDGHLKLAY